MNIAGGVGRGQLSGKYDGTSLAYGMEYGRESGRWGSAWWYDSGGGWDGWSGWDGWDEGGVRVCSLRRASRDCIISISERTSADIDGKEAIGEHGGCLVGSG